MCKVFMMSNVTKVKAFKKLIDTAHDLITRQDDDGFGYAFQGIKGAFGEKTINKTWKYGSKVPTFAQSSITEKMFGTASALTGPALFHGRTSTNHVNLLNTHPLQKNGWTLIHNGVVRNLGPEYEMETTNDTEHLLHYLTTQGIGGIEQNISGYYAIGALDADGQLHIVRDDVASLYTCYSKTVSSWLFATTESFLEKICKEMDWTRGTIREFDKNKYIVMKGNEIVSEQRIQPRGYGYSESQYMQRSLGRTHSGARVPEVIVGAESGEDKKGNEEDRSYSSYSDLCFEAWMHEIDNMDASYEVYNPEGTKLTIFEFRKLDLGAKTMCEIYRHDGTKVDIDDYYTETV